jgi:UDP-N-acetylmuramate--alanine ligase
VLTDVYPAREQPIEGITGALIADAARAAGHRHVQYVERLDDIPDALQALLRPGDLLLTMGAGNVSTVAGRVIH